MYNFKFIKDFKAFHNRVPNIDECSIHNIMKRPKINNALHGRIYCDIIWAIVADCLDALTLWYHHVDGMLESASIEEEHAFLYELNEFKKKGVI